MKEPDLNEEEEIENEKKNTGKYESSQEVRSKVEVEIAFARPKS